MIKTPYLSFRKSVEFVMLIIFSITNITSSYAMEDGDVFIHEGSPLRKRGKSFQEVSPDSVALVDIDVKSGGQKKRPSLTHQTSIIAPTCLYRGVSVEDEDEVEIRKTKSTDMEEGKRNLGGVSLDFSLSIQKPIDPSDENDVDTTETDSPIHKSKTPIGRAKGESIDAINVIIEEGDVAVGSPIYTPKTKVTEDQRIPISDPSTCSRACFYSKKTISVIFSLFASLSFGILAYGLGEEINKGSAIVMSADGLIANTLLYYTIYDGLSTGDFFVDWNQPRSKNAALLCFGVLNLIASIPLGYYIGYSSVLGYTPGVFAQVTGAISFISLLLLYSKAATRFSNDIINKANMMKLKGEKREYAYSRQAYLEETSALWRNEVDNLYNLITSNEQENDFNKIMLKLKPRGVNDRFWAKEIAGGISGFGLAGGFAGTYLFEIGLSVYNLFFQEMAPQLSKHIMTKLSYAGASAIAVGPNVLQIERTNNAFKIYTTWLSRSYDSCLKRNRLVSSGVFDIEEGEADFLVERKTSWQESSVDALAFGLAGGVALTRTALCLKYIKDRSLVDIVTVSTTITYFCIYYLTINSLFDGWSETGRKRNIIAKYINAEFDKLDAEKKEDDRL